MRQSAKLGSVHVYCGVVAAVGISLLVGLSVGESHAIADAVSWQFLLFSAFVVFGELRPISVPRGDAESSVTISTLFAFVLLLSFGTAPAVLSFGLASLIGDLVSRAKWWKALFNVGQYTLAMAAAGVILDTLGLQDEGSIRFSAPVLLVVLLAGAVFFLVNVGVTAVAVAMVQRLPLLTFLRQDLLFHAASTGVLIAISPIVVVAADHSLALIPVIIVPMLVAYKTASTTLEKEHQALHDALTGLPNRTLFYDRAQQAVLAARRDGTATAVMIIDLDRFKEINDTLGHHTGDLLLKQVGPRLQGVLRDSDTVARLGGDEFGVLLRRVQGVADVELLAERITSALDQPFQVNDLRLEVGASIGSALYPEHGQDAETLIQRADVAMYMAKADHDGHAIYNPANDQHSTGRLTLVSELRQAIEAGQLVVYYQPKISLRSGEVDGVEALLRWNHPTRGMVSPDEFIPLAEQTGLIKPLTLFVVEQALRQCRAWHEAGHRIRMAVNLSARMVHDTQLPGVLRRLLEVTAMAPHWLDLELTETSIMADQTRSLEVLSALDALGVSLSVDDFGTGYSSLAYLKRLPVDEIKIDRSFVMHMGEDDNDAVIVRSTIDLGRNLGLRVVAEGVETAEVLTQLADMGCDIAQGYYFSRPIPASAMTEWLAHFKADRSGRAPLMTAGDLG
jgi:diguanylate cyclase (GGDEF)-like protein